MKISGVQSNKHPTDIHTTDIHSSINQSYFVFHIKYNIIENKKIYIY